MLSWQLSNNRANYRLCCRLGLKQPSFHHLRLKSRYRLVPMSKRRQDCSPTGELTVSYPNDTASASLPTLPVPIASAPNRSARQWRTTDHPSTRPDSPTGLLVSIDNSPLPTWPAQRTVTANPTGDDNPRDTNHSVNLTILASSDPLSSESRERDTAVQPPTGAHGRTLNPPTPTRHRAKPDIMPIGANSAKHRGLDTAVQPLTGAHGRTVTMTLPTLTNSGAMLIASSSTLHSAKDTDEVQFR